MAHRPASLPGVVGGGVNVMLMSYSSGSSRYTGRPGAVQPGEEGRPASMLSSDSDEMRERGPPAVGSGCQPP